MQNKLGSSLLLLCLIVGAGAVISTYDDLLETENYNRYPGVSLYPEYQYGAKPASSCSNAVVDEGLNTILSNGALQFSLNLYHKLKAGTNIIFSPFSIRVALAMTDAGAGGNTLSQMDKTLYLELFPTADQSLLAFQSYLSSFCSDDKFHLSTANRIYLKKDFPIDPSFTSKIGKYYLSSAENVDFVANPKEVAETINQWVEQQTKSAIKNLVSPNSFTDETILVLVNAIYFKGKWKNLFDPAKPETFTLASGQSIQVPTMSQTSNYKYTFSSPLKSQVLQLDYEGDRVAMFIILPQKGTSLSIVQQTLNFNNVFDCVNKVSETKVQIFLPKFQASFREELKGPLQLLGMVDAFDVSTSNFSRMTAKPWVYVDQVIHQAFVAVDEKGTVAAAATSVMHLMMASAPMPPVEFKVDRPCIYFIYDLKYKEILFMGNLDNPLS